MHIVVRSARGYRFVQLDGGRSFKPTDASVFWSDRSLKQEHSIVRESGRIVGEYLQPNDPGSRVGEPDPAYAGLWAAGPGRPSPPARRGLKLSSVVPVTVNAGGVYVSIQTKLGRDALLAATRALKPV